MERAKSTPEIAEEAEITAPFWAFRLDENALTEKIIGAAIEVHRHLGPGLLESAYEECLCFELSQMEIPFQRQVHLPVEYKDVHLDCGYRMDLVVNEQVVIEIKTVDSFLPIHSAQLLTYLKLSSKPIGLLINFSVPILRKGLKRIVNRYVQPLSPAGISAPSARSGVDLDSPEISRSPRLRASAVDETAAVNEAIY